jgi:transcriptional regulator with XRE-family HTH domain
MQIDGTHCRMARAALGISNSELAAAANVGVNTLSRFEQGQDVRLSSANAIKAALEGMGIRFIARGDVAEVDAVGVIL